MIALLRRMFGAPEGGGPELPAGGAGRLAVEGVRKAFGQTLVLDDVDLATEAGEFVTLLGPSGCGKTTLLRIVAGLERACAGRVLLDGRPLDGLPASRRPVNTVFQSYALFPHLDVFENVAFGLRARRFPEADVRRRVDWGLELLRLEPLARRRPDQLSGGQRQRVALARALVNEPTVLLLDEPLSALDARLRAEVQLELRRLQRDLGRTFVLVTHDQDEALTVSDRLVVMDQGRIVQSGPAQEVYRRPRTRFVAEFLGAANLVPAVAVGERRVRTELGELELDEAPPWEEGTLAIHPRWVEAASEEPARNGVRVRARDVVPRGDHALLVAEQVDLRAQLPPDRLPAAGEELWLHLPAERLVPLDD